MRLRIRERLLKTDPLARTLLASPLGATGVGRWPLPSRARVGNGWGKKGRQTAGLWLPAYSFIPPQVPLDKDWGALWGDWRGKRWPPATARLEFKCAAAAKLC